MLNNRMKWILIFSALLWVVIACSKKEEAPPTPAPSETAPKAAMEPAAKEGHEGMMEETHEAMEKVHEGMEGMQAQMQEGQEQMAADIDMEKGEEIYENHCLSCHKTGVAGAPKTGDKEDWADHIAHGMDHMVNNAINGVGAMPPKGGASSLSDEEVRAAVAWMVEQSK
jgi:cytochrome c5